MLCTLNHNLSTALAIMHCGTSHHQPPTMIPTVTLSKIAVSAHQYAKKMANCFGYRVSLRIGFRSAWEEHYTTIKQVVADTIEDVYSACTAFNTGVRKYVTIKRDLRRKGLNCEVLADAYGSTRKLSIRFAAIGALNELIRMCGTYSFSLDEFIKAIKIVAPTIERRLMIDEILADLSY